MSLWVCWWEAPRNPGRNPAAGIVNFCVNAHFDALNGGIGGKIEIEGFVIHACVILAPMNIESLALRYVYMPLVALFGRRTNH